MAGCGVSAKTEPLPLSACSDSGLASSQAGWEVLQIVSVIVVSKVSSPSTKALSGVSASCKRLLAQAVFKDQA